MDSNQDTPHHNSRKGFRFSSDPATVALFYLVTQDNTSNPSFAGLVINESYNGCLALINFKDGLVVDQTLKIKVGSLSKLNAQVVWVKNLEENIYKVGFKFLE